MQTSRFQMTLTTAMAVGFGAAMTWGLGAGEAIGYPAGAAISYGSNPTFSYGGEGDGGTSVTAVTVPSGQRAIITDVVLTTWNSSITGCASAVTLSAGSDTLGRFQVGSNTSTYDVSYGADGVSHAFSSGLPVPSGASLNINISGSCTISYTVSGYYAEA
jgi:hypothetical protein